MITLEWQTWLLISVIGFTFYLYAEVRDLRMRLRQHEKTNHPSTQEFSPELDQELAALVRQGEKYKPSSAFEKNTAGRYLKPNRQ
ncbi:hypothetical protein ACRPK6_12750 [Exiguobacterium sp. TRN 1102]|uniref:hypothetical protein n=1 Tax=Exiguobacterium sp. TRN 1102 TaxID=3420732 RepID=UPI003D76EF0A